MAVDPRSVPYTREQVAAWLDEFTGETDEDLRTFLEGKLGDDAGMLVDTRAMNRDFTPLIDMILDDLSSYGFSLDG
jgi:hypothetical protein